MALGKHGRDVAIAGAAVALAASLAWVGVLLWHPASKFILEIKLQFDVP